jgi:spore coat protein H
MRFTRFPARAAGLAALILVFGACPEDESPFDHAPSAADGASSPEQPGESPEINLAAHLFDDVTVHTYEITVAPSDWKWLNDNALLEEYVPATLTFEGQVYRGIGVRYKGSASTLRNCFNSSGDLICPKLSIKLDFSEYQPGQRFHGLKQLHFNNMVKDRSMMHDRLAYWLFTEMGVPAPRATHSRVVVNGQDHGLYSMVEDIDGRFTRRHFADGGRGNLYKEFWPIHANESWIRDSLRSNRGENTSVDRMLRFSRALGGAAGGQERVDTLAAFTDLDAFLTVLAVDRAADHLDGLTTFYCWSRGCFNHNYYWYEETGRDRMWLIPWDYDQAFQVPNWNREAGMPDWFELPSSPQDCALLNISGLMMPPACDPILASIVTHAWPRFVQRGHALLAGPFVVNTMLERLAVWEAQIDSAVQADPLASYRRWKSALEDLRADLPVLRSRFEAELALTP